MTGNRSDVSSLRGMVASGDIVVLTISSGFRPKRTSTSRRALLCGGLSIVAHTSTPLPTRSMAGARMNTAGNEEDEEVDEEPGPARANEA
jgi:hypothetical protein